MNSPAKSLSKRPLLVADTGPLIALARCNYLGLINHYFNEICIPKAVHGELQLNRELPGVHELRIWLRSGEHISVKSPKKIPAELVRLLDPGESEAIALAEQLEGVLLIDEQRGRITARKRGIPFLGTGRLFVAAKRDGHLSNLQTALRDLRKNGYRLSEALCLELLRMAGE